MNILPPERLNLILEYMKGLNPLEVLLISNARKGPITTMSSIEPVEYSYYQIINPALNAGKVCLYGEFDGYSILSYLFYDVEIRHTCSLITKDINIQREWLKKKKRMKTIQNDPEK